MNITREEAIEYMADEIEKNVKDGRIGSSKDFATGIFEGLTLGLNFNTTSFLAVHGTEQRVRHYARQTLIRQNIIRDPSAPPAGLA